MESIEQIFGIATIIRVPNDYEIKYDSIDSLSGKVFPYINVIENEHNIIKFYPNSLIKSIHPFKDGIQQNEVHTTGTASDLFRRSESIENGLKLLHGKSICVTKCTIYQVMDETAHKLVTSAIHQYDIVP